MALLTISVLAAGAMGSAIGKLLTNAGCTVLTNLDGRSENTRDRAARAGMEDVSFEEISRRSDWVLSILPPSDAFSLAQKVLASSGSNSKFAFVDCNATNPESAKKIAKLFEGSGVGFVDAVIIGQPPREGYTPKIYASSAEGDGALLERFEALSRYGLKIELLIGNGAGIGDASALKMSYSGITKGLHGLFATMMLAAHAASPATASALLRELKMTQPMLAQRLVQGIPKMIPKACRWVGEMEEISGFVGGEEGDIHKGMASLFGRIGRSVKEGGTGEVEILELLIRDGGKD